MQKKENGENDFSSYVLSTEEKNQLDKLDQQLNINLPKIENLVRKYKRARNIGRNQERIEAAHKEVIDEVLELYKLLINKNLLFNFSQRDIYQTNQQDLRMKNNRKFFFYVIASARIIECLEIYDKDQINLFLTGILIQLSSFIGYDLRDHQPIEIDGYLQTYSYLN